MGKMAFNHVWASFYVGLLHHFFTNIPLDDQKDTDYFVQYLKYVNQEEYRNISYPYHLKMGYYFLYSMSTSEVFLYIIKIVRIALYPYGIHVLCLAFFFSFLLSLFFIKYKTANILGH